MQREHGAFIIDGVQTASTLQCPHCGCHFVSVPGSGRRRAFCFKCMAVTCGKADCDECIPEEARLEFAEGTKTKYDDKIKQLLGEGAQLL